MSKKSKKKKKKNTAQKQNIQKQSTSKSGVQRQNAQTPSVQRQNAQTSNVQRQNAQTSSVPRQGAQTSSVQGQGTQTPHAQKQNVHAWNGYFALFLGIALCGCCAAVLLMLWYASDRTAVIADVTEEQAGISTDFEQPGNGEQETALNLLRTYGAEGSFCIPLPKGIKPENVFMENRYMDRELRIYVQSEETEFYKENSLYGDISPIVAGCSELREDGILLKLEMGSVLEYRSTMEKNVLTIAYSEPHEMYDFIVVLDPAGGGSETGIDGYGISEKELALEVARQVQGSFSMANVRLYLTRREDTDVDAQERIGFAEMSGADLYIRIGARVAGDPSIYGIEGSYNEEYFIPGFGNVDLADTVTREVTIAASNRAVGLVAAEEDSILRSIKLPAVELSVGYLSNPQEMALLQQEPYREKLAEGICNAIAEACERLEQVKRNQEE